MAERDEVDGLDGRVQRSQRSRERIMDALIELVREGHAQPTGQEVADRAGMNLRSVFRHFDDIESLYRAIHEKLQQTLVPLIYQEVATGSLDHRITEFVRCRTRAYEQLAPFQRSERLGRWKSPALEAVHRQFVVGMRRDLETRLPEVDELPGPVRAAAEMMTSFEAWDRLRLEQGLGPRQTAAAIEAGLRRLLGAERASR